jgi:hypothetical protein
MGALSPLHLVRTFLFGGLVFNAYILIFVSNCRNNVPGITFIGKSAYSKVAIPSIPYSNSSSLVFSTLGFYKEFLSHIRVP